MSAAAVSASIELNRSNPLLPLLTQRWSKVACGACHTDQYTVHSWMGLCGPALTCLLRPKSIYKSPNYNIKNLVVQLENYTSVQN